MTPGAPSGPLPTFRDPDGQVEVRDDIVLRHVHPQAQQQALDLLASPFLERAVKEGLLCSSAVRPGPASSTLTLEHPRVFFPSYCWEWSPAQWVAAGELTLTLCEDAVRSGWILKDATPLNVLFEGTRPLFVDVLSFDRRDPRSAVWEAQGQFVRTFLLPLIAHGQLGWPLASSLLRRDGLTPELLLPFISPAARLRPAIFWNITLPALIERRVTVSESKIGAAKTRRFDPEVATALLLRRLGKLRKQLRQLGGGFRQTGWSQYQEKLAHYQQSDQSAKRAFVAECLAQSAPRTVLDIGANTGTYSLLAAQSGARVIAIDTDESSIELLHRRARTDRADIQALVVNLGRPTPATGWRNGEQLSFLDRATGRFDTVLMLAVLHHLLLTEQIPLAHIAALCSALARRHLVLEWVPPTDPLFQELLRGRAHLYAQLSENDLLAAFSPHFRTERRLALGNGRILFHLARLP